MLTSVCYIISAGVDSEPEVLDSVVYQGRICSIIWLDSDHVLTSGPKGEAVSVYGLQVYKDFVVCLCILSFFTKNNSEPIMRILSIVVDILFS